MPFKRNYLVLFVFAVILFGCENPAKLIFDNQFDSESSNRTPDKPINLNIISVFKKQIILTWTDQSSFESGYKIERAQFGDSLIEIASVPANVTNFTDTTLDPSKIFQYRIRAYDKGNFSAYSQTITIKFIPFEVASSAILTQTAHVVAYNSEGTLLATSAGEDITLWNPATNSIVRTIKGNGGTNSLSFSPKGDLIAGAGGGVVTVYRVSDGALVKSYNDIYWNPSSVHFCPDGTKIIFASDRAIRILSVSTFEIISEWSAQPGMIQMIAYSPDGSKIVSSDYDGTVNLWNANDHSLIRTFNGGVHAQCAFHPDGATMSTLGRYASGIYGGLRVWKVSDGSLVKNFGGLGFIWNPIRYTKDGLTLIARDYSNVTVIDTRDNSLIFNEPLSGQIDIISMDINPIDNSLCMSYNSESGTKIIIWHFKYKWIKKE